MRDRHPPGASDALMLGAICSALAVGFLVWLWGGLAGALFGEGWPAVGSGQLPAVVVRLPARLADPSRAWPSAVRANLPGPSGFYAVLALMGGAAGLAGFLLARVRSVHRPTPGAKWARRADLRALHGWALAGHQSRLTLGRRRGQLLRAEQRRIYGGVVGTSG